ncbi:MAG: sugar phosphate nucleotidyltransferase [Elusimicrobiaceae bacterium]|nr:sugar phosphate nucleotidyltransferase [Elusimicrobiaceae bacterium]
MQRKFSAVVPVAGTGTRLKPHTNTYPKVLLTVGDKPILGHILDQLIGLGTPEIFLVVGYLGDKIRQYVAAKYPGLNVRYAEQHEPRGLGHAISLTEKLVAGPVFILLGDTILSADLAPFTDFSCDRLGVKSVPDPRRFGVVETGPDGIVTSLVEKPEHPASNLAIVGAYSFSDSAVLYASLNRLVASGKTTKGEIQFTDALMDLVASGRRLRTVPIDGWYDCGKPETLLATNRFLLDRNNRQDGPVCGGCMVIPPVYIAPGANLRNSIVGPYVSLGDGVTVENCIVENSIINEHAALKNVIIKDSLIGPDAVFKSRSQRINIGENSEIFLGGETAE